MPNVVPDELGLLPVASVEWGGWLFVNVDGEAPPFAEHLGGFADLLAPWGTGALRVGATHPYALAANWKVAIENYHECYHCPLIHPELCQVSPANSGINVDEVPGAFVGGAMRLADSATTMSLDGRSPLAPLPGLDDDRRRQVLYVQLFPNLLVSLHPDYVMTHRITPLTPTTSTIECQWLFAADGDRRAGRSTRRSPSTSGTSPTARTGRRSSPCSAASIRAASCPACSPPTRTRCTTSASMVAAAYQGGPPTRAVIGAARPGRCADPRPLQFP